MVLGIGNQRHDGARDFIYCLYVAHRRHRDPKLAFLTRARGTINDSDDNDEANLADIRRTLEIASGSKHAHCMPYGLSVNLLQNRTSGIDIDIKVYNVRNFGSPAST